MIFLNHFSLPACKVEGADAEEELVEAFGVFGGGDLSVSTLSYWTVQTLDTVGLDPVHLDPVFLDFACLTPTSC